MAIDSFQGKPLASGHFSKVNMFSASKNVFTLLCSIITLILTDLEFVATVATGGRVKVLSAV